MALTFASNASNPTLKMPLSGSGVARARSPNSRGLNFGNVQTGNNQTLAGTVTNSGGSRVTVTQATVTGSGFTVNGLNLPLNLAPGQSGPNFNVVFAPQSAGAASGTILPLTSNASNSTLNIPLSGTGVAPGALTASPSSLNFGNVQTGNNQTLTETLTNSGGSSVTITQAAVTGSGFTVNGLNLPLTLAPSQAAPVSTSCFPRKRPERPLVTLSLTSNASNPTLNIPLSGTGVTGRLLPANPSSLNFGNVQTGNNQTLAGTVTNSGGSSVTITQATVTGGGSTVNGLNLPLTLARAKAAPVSTLYFLTAAGAASGTLSLTSNASTQRSTSLCRARSFTRNPPQIHPASASATCRSATIRLCRKR